MENQYNQTTNMQMESRLREVRKMVSNMGTLIGKTICFITVDNLDISHKEKEVSNTHPRLVEPLKKYMVNTVLVTKQELRIIGDEIYLEFNGESSLRAKLTPSAAENFFATASDGGKVEEAVQRALNGATPIYFADRKKLTEEVNFRNKEVAKKAQMLANAFLEQMTLIQNLIKNQDQSCEDYLKQYGL